LTQKELIGGLTCGVRSIRGLGFAKRDQCVTYLVLLALLQFAHGIGNITINNVVALKTERVFHPPIFTFTLSPTPAASDCELRFAANSVDKRRTAATEQEVAVLLDIQAAKCVKRLGLECHQPLGALSRRC